MSIRQVNLNFNSEEDRLYMKLNTVSQEEFRFCLTRRFVKIFWPVLIQLLGKEFIERAPEKVHAAPQMMAFEHEKALAKADYTRQYEVREFAFPLGEAYLLLSRISVRQDAEGALLCLAPTSGKGIELRATPDFIHLICDILAKTLRQTGWELEGLLQKTRVAAPMAVPASKTLH